MNNRYKIGEAAKLMNITAETIRYYEEIALIKPKRDSKNGYRYYDVFDLEVLKEIVTYRSIDMPTEKIKKYFETKKVTELIEYLELEEKKVDERLEELKLIKSSISRKVKHLNDVEEDNGEIKIKKFGNLYFYQIVEFLNINEESYEEKLIDFSNLEKTWVAESDIVFLDINGNECVYLMSETKLDHKNVSVRNLGLALSQISIFKKKQWFDRIKIDNYIKDNNYEKNGKGFVKKIHASQGSTKERLIIYELIQPIKEVETTQEEK